MFLLAKTIYHYLKTPLEQPCHPPVYPIHVDPTGGAPNLHTQPTLRITLHNNGVDPPASQDKDEDVAEQRPEQQARTTGH